MTDIDDQTLADLDTLITRLSKRRAKMRQTDNHYHGRHLSLCVTGLENVYARFATYAKGSHESGDVEL